VSTKEGSRSALLEGLTATSRRIDKPGGSVYLRNERSSDKGSKMSDSREEGRPAAAIPVGICFAGACVALSVALQDGEAVGAGVASIGIGSAFIAIGEKNRQERERCCR
jgi:hypothetical protein